MMSTAAVHLLQNVDLNVYNIWRKILEEQEKIAKARLAAVQVYVDEVEKDAKAVKIAKQAKTKKYLERLGNVQKDLQGTVAEVGRGISIRLHKVRVIQISYYNHSWTARSGFTSTKRPRPTWFGTRPRLRRTRPAAGRRT